MTASIFRTLSGTVIPVFAGTWSWAASAANPALASDFGSWPKGTSPEEIGRRVAARFVASPHPNFNSPKPPPVIRYPETCAWYGALTFAQLSGDKALTAQLVKRFEPLFGAEAHLIAKRPNDVDTNVFGVVPLELYRQTKDPRYLAMGQRFADRQWEKPEQPENLKPEAREAVAHDLSFETRYWIDDMYMITMLQTQAYRATGDIKYIDRAAREMAAYLDRLQQPNGLFFHAPDVPYFWGRGNGWFAVGMAELLRSLPADHPLRPRILAGYRRMMASLLKFQDAQGMWHQLIDHPEAWPETSCTGMFAFAFITGVKNGWLDEKDYGSAARKAWLGLVGYLDENADVREVCEGTNKRNNLQYYLDRGRKVGDMHGQAPILWCASALLR